MNNIKKIKLASNGLLDNVPSEITLKQMTGSDISTIYSSFTDASIDRVITNCIVDPKDLDLTLITKEDKLLILHQIRVLTFGNTFKQTLRCPKCNQIHEYEISYDDIPITYLDKDYVLNNTLQIGEHTYTRKIATIKDFDNIRFFKEKFKIPEYDNFILSLMTSIEKVDNKKLSNLELYKHLAEMTEGRYLVEIFKFINTSYGLAKTFNVSCDTCGNLIQGVIGISADLFC